MTVSDYSPRDAVRDRTGLHHKQEARLVRSRGLMGGHDETDVCLTCFTVCPNHRAAFCPFIQPGLPSGHGLCYQALLYRCDAACLVFSPVVISTLLNLHWEREEMCCPPPPPIEHMRPSNTDHCWTLLNKKQQKNHAVGDIRNFLSSPRVG
ncbi:hypothetical protein Bpfe_001454 [Biomphalaria pfeifferi]|uniref:Uncharacterized protein n=1 Tax=Biomphalaria pfeifferi TaxID=112525 RepID=A0AAD8FLD3_BIOPF|nr:hypothetical protein Bpfe_001454 [Biomphalaria pfeifferi]